MSSDSGKVFLGVLAGLAAGALLGVLFAPDKGSETRKKIIKKGEDYTEGIKDKFNDLIDELNQKIDAAKTKAREAASETGNVEDSTV
jgi:gas vesicle protein